MATKPELEIVPLEPSASYSDKEKEKEKFFKQTIKQVVSIFLQ